MTAKPISITGNPRKPAVDAVITADDQTALWNAILVADKYARSATDRATVKAANAAALRYGFPYNTTAEDVAAARVSDDALPAALYAVMGGRTTCGSPDAAIAFAGLELLGTAAQRLTGQPQADVFANLNRARVAVTNAARRLRGDAPEPDADPLRSHVAFEMTTKGTGLAVCTVTIPKDAAAYRVGRAIVHQLAAKVEAFAPSPTWAADVEVELTSGGVAATGVRGHVSVRLAGDDDGNQGRALLHNAAGAVLRDLAANGVPC